MSRTVFPLFIDAWISKTRKLPDDEARFYIDMLLLLWRANGRVPNDAQEICDELGRKSIRPVKRLIDKLIARGMIIVHGDTLGNKRVDEELAKISARSEAASTREISKPKRKFGPSLPEVSPKLGPNFRQTSAKFGESLDQTSMPEPTKSMACGPEEEHEKGTEKAEPIILKYLNERKEPPTPLQGDASVQPEFELKGETAKPSPGMQALSAYQAWNAMALRCGLPQEATLPKSLAAKINARIKEGGQDSWALALANIEKSSFLTGESASGWSADLGWLCRKENFKKVHSGKYGNGRHTQKDKAAELTTVLDAWCAQFAKDGYWTQHSLAGPPPGSPGCTVPADILAKHGLTNYTPPSKPAFLANASPAFRKAALGDEQEARQ